MRSWRAKGEGRRGPDRRNGRASPVRPPAVSHGAGIAPASLGTGSAAGMPALIPPSGMFPPTTILLGRGRPGLEAVAHEGCAHPPRAFCHRPERYRPSSSPAAGSWPCRRMGNRAGWLSSYPPFGCATKGYGAGADGRVLHRAQAACCAISRRRSGVSVSRRRLPPILPPRLPRHAEQSQAIWTYATPRAARASARTSS
jgi:hypothetical protein